MSRPRMSRAYPRQPSRRDNSDALAIAHDALDEIDRIGDLLPKRQGGPEARRKDRAMARLGWALDILFPDDRIVLGPDDEGDE